LADFALDKCPLKARPIYDVPGPVPQLRIDDLIGRREELRQTLRSLRDPGRQYAGVVLSGIGGAGKSAVAGRVMCRLTEDGWRVAAHRGRFDLAAIAAAVGAALLQSDREPAQRRGALLARADLDDLSLLGQALAEEPLLLVLDDFEANLTTGGDVFLDDDAALYLRVLSQQAHRGRLLITSRHPVPGRCRKLNRPGCASTCLGRSPSHAASTTRGGLRLSMPGWWMNWPGGSASFRLPRMGRVCRLSAASGNGCADDGKKGEHAAHCSPVWC
jgi:hypothetical protein